MILSKQTPQGRNRANGGAGPHLNRLFPQIHALPYFVFNSDAFFNAQGRQTAVAQLIRYYGTYLIELFGFLAVKQVKLSHTAIPRKTAWRCQPPSIDPLELRTANQGLRFQLFGQKEKSSGELSSGGDSSWPGSRGCTPGVVSSGTEKESRACVRFALPGDTRTDSSRLVGLGSIMKFSKV